MLHRVTGDGIDGVVFSEISRFFRPEFLDQYGITKALRENHKLMVCDIGALNLENQVHQLLIS
jgi:hypothetical protein